MQWKAYFYNKKKHYKENEIQTIRETYGLKSLNWPLQVKELIQFDLLNLINSLKFRKTRSHYVCYRVLTNGKNKCYITLNNHKPNFKNNPKVRLINSAKNEIGRVSENILDKTNQKPRNSLRINQWKDTSEAIECFLKIPNKNRYKLAIFDIKDFYPPISEKPLDRTCNICTTPENHFCLVMKNRKWKEKRTFLTSP